MGIRITDLPSVGSSAPQTNDLVVVHNQGQGVTGTMSYQDFFGVVPTNLSEPMFGRARLVVHTNTGQVVTPASTSQGDLMTFTIPANNMFVAGRQVNLQAWGTTGGSTGNVNIKLHFGGSVVVESTVTSTAGTWLANATIIHIDSSASEVVASFVEGSNHIVTRSLSSVRSTAAIITRVTGQKSGSTTVDATQEGYVVDFAS